MVAEPQVVMFVLNDCRSDVRVLREAATLRDAGYRVTIMARTTDPYAERGEREERPDGVVIIRLPVARGPLRWALRARRPADLAGAVIDWVRHGPRAPLRFVLRGAAVAGLAIATAPVTVPLALVGWLGARAVTRVPALGAVWLSIGWRLQWRFSVLPWATAVASAAPPAAIVHAHDMRGLPAAAQHRRSTAARFIYDSHELYVEAGLNARRPAPARQAMRRLERRSAMGMDALVTVNDALAVRLGTSLGAPRTVVVRNCPPVGPLAEPRPDRLRAALDLAADTPVALYHGGFMPDRGLVETILAWRRPELARVHLVLMGSGALEGSLRELAADPASGGRVHLLPPVPPEALLEWVASADVGLMLNQPRTLNERLSTPNKLFECLAVGTPVVSSDFPERRHIIIDDPDGPLGMVCDPTDPAAIAGAVRAIVEQPPEAQAAWRVRIHAAAAVRYTWEVDRARLLNLYADLAGATETVPQRVTYLVPGTGVFDSRTQRLGASMAARGHRVRIIGRAAPDAPDEETLADGVHVVRVATAAAPDRMRSGRDPIPRLVGETLRVGAVWRAAAAQRRAAQAVDDGAELYHAMGFLGLPVGLSLAGRAGSPLVYDARDIYAESNNLARMPSPVRVVFRLRERRWAHRASRVFTVNDALAAYLERSLAVPKPAVVMNCPPVGPLAEPRPDRLRAALDLAADTPVALYHGGFMPDRGLVETILAWRRPELARVHLVLMGSGALEGSLRELAADPASGGRVHLLPPVPPEALLEWVASADVGLMLNQPRTLNERLSTPNKLFECLAVGTPVVSSDFPERRHIIIDDPDGPLGMVCDPTDPAAIAGAVRAIVEQPPEAQAAWRVRIHAAAAVRYTWTGQLAIVLAEYERLTGRPW